MSRDLTGGLLIGAGIGFGIAWLVRSLGNGDQERIIILKTRADGTPGIAKQPEYVEIRKGKKLTWWVANQTQASVDVSIQNWRDAQGNPKTPAVNPDLDANDVDQPAQNQLSRRVPAGAVRKIQSKARPPAFLFEEVHYDVFLNGNFGLDPIVKLTP